MTNERIKPMKLPKINFNKCYCNDEATCLKHIEEHIEESSGISEVIKQEE